MITSQRVGWRQPPKQTTQQQQQQQKNKKKWFFFLLRRRRSTWHRRQKKSSDVVCESLTTARVSRDSALNLSTAPSTLIGERFPFMNWKWNDCLFLNSGFQRQSQFSELNSFIACVGLFISESDKWQIVWEDEIFAQSCYPLMFHECLVYYPACFSVDWTLSNQTNHNF